MININLKFFLKWSFVCMSDIFDIVICCYRLSVYFIRIWLMVRYFGLIYFYLFRIWEESLFCSDIVCKMFINKFVVSFYIIVCLYIINI